MTEDKTLDPWDPRGDESTDIDPESWDNIDPRPKPTSAVARRNPGVGAIGDPMDPTTKQKMKEALFGHGESR